MDQFNLWLTSKYDLLLVVAWFSLAFGVLLLLLLFVSKSVRSKLNLSIIKIGIEAYQFLAAAIGIQIAVIGKDSKWYELSWLCVLNLLIYKIVVVINDQLLKSNEQVLLAKIDALQNEAELRTDILSFVQDGIRSKEKRILKAIRDRKPKIMSTVKEALQPAEQLTTLLQKLILFLETRAPADAPRSFDIRVGLYVESDGCMKPMRGASRANQNYNPFTSYHKHEKEFQISNTYAKSNVVKVAKNNKIMIIENCDTCSDEDYRPFNNNQRSYIKSMVVYPMENVVTPSQSERKCVLAIDSDWPCFFEKSNEDEIKGYLMEFKCRLKLEMATQALLTSDGASNGTKK